MTGYCEACHSIVDLTSDGRLARHGYAISDRGEPRKCVRTGCFPSPPPETPEVTEAAFGDEARPARCSRCRCTEPIGIDRPGGKFFVQGHFAPNAPSSGALCPGSWLEPEFYTP